jgi:cellulose synthase/poly-beta-1,6-N-acetylglucosamine synthase-like glycosyltransferase
MSYGCRVHISTRLMLVELFLILAVCYTVLILLFTAATVASRYPASPGFRPNVSVLVAARNEEQNIVACLESLSRLTYPRDLLEIIVIDDRSSDGTGSIVEGYARNNPSIRLIRIEEEGKLRGKTNAVARGIDVSSGEILLFTDADCRVPEGWVEETVQYYSSGQVGAVAGFTSLRGAGWFSRMQALDWLVLSSAAAATTRLGFPTTAIGTNLTVRRKAYHEAGGYEKIPFSVTEDYALFHAVTGPGGYRARIPLGAATLVESGPCSSWQELYRQKKRWFTGGRGMDLKSLLVFTIPYLFNLSLPIGAFIFPTPPVLWALAAKLAADLLFCLPAVIRFRRADLLPVFPVYELYYYLYVLIFPPLVLLTSKVTWKGRSFT